jgi:hypothetical protein
MEKFMGILGGIASILPFTILLYKGLTSETWKNIMANKAAAKQDGKNAKAKLPKLIAGIGEKILAGDYVTAAIVAGILTALGAAIAIGAGAASRKKEQDREQNTAAIEAAEKSNEIAKAAKTESNAIDELVS